LRRLCSERILSVEQGGFAASVLKKVPLSQERFSTDPDRRAGPSAAVFLSRPARTAAKARN
jgi:hypothetical protein